jgi:hypothetical protein
MADTYDLYLSRVCGGETITMNPSGWGRRVNAMTVATFEKLGFKENELVRTTTSISVFTGDVREAKGVT